MPKDEDARLDALREYHLLDTPAEEGYDDVTRLAAFICGTPIAAVTLIDADRQWFKSVFGLDVRETPRDVSFCAHTILQPCLLVVPDATEDARFADNPLVTGEPHIRFYAGMPLITDDGRALGSLCVVDRVPHTLTSEQQQALRTLARQVMGRMDLTRRSALQDRLMAERERAEQSAEILHRRVSDVLESITDAFFALDDEWRFTYINSPAERLLQRTREELLDKCLWDEFPEIVGSIFDREYRRAVADRAIAAFEEFYPLLGVWLEVRAYPSPEGLSIYFHDINARKEVEIERRRSEEAVWASTRFAQGTLDGLSAQIAILDRAGIILAVNESWRRFAAESGTGLRDVAETVNYLQVCDHVSGANADEARDTADGIRSVASGEREFFALEYASRLAREKRWFNLRVTRFHGEGRLPGRERPCVIVSYEDVTERRHAGMVIRQSEERFRQMAENIREVFWMSDPASGRILYISPAYETVWGRTCQSLYEQPDAFAEAVHPEDRDVYRDAVIAKGRSGVFDAEYRIARPDGTIRWIWGRAFPVRDGQGTVYREAGIAQDITERRRTQEATVVTARKLQTLSGRLLAVQEAERREIARELHGQIGQVLTGLSLTLAIGKRLTGEPLARNQAQVDDLVREALSHVRQITLELRPAILDDLGLLPALVWHFERFTAQTQIRVDFRHARVVPRFSRELETVTYRIVQEALTNVARHAAVNEARVRLWTKRGKLCVKIEDGGAGFVPEQAQGGYVSSGLTGMQERAGLLGGRLQIEAAPGVGTCILAEFPTADSAALDGHIL